MTTATQRTNFRLDLGLADDETVFTDDEIDALFIRAAAKYSVTEVKEAYVLVLGARQLRNKSASLTDYEANDSSEKLSQVFKNLDKLYADLYGEFVAVRDANRSSMRVARPKRKPARKVEWPDA